MWLINETYSAIWTAITGLGSGFLIPIQFLFLPFFFFGGSSELLLTVRSDIWLKDDVSLGSLNTIFVGSKHCASNYKAEMIRLSVASKVALTVYKKCQKNIFLTN